MFRLGTERWDWIIMDIADQFIGSESEIHTYVWESAQLYYQKWSSYLGDSNHYQEAGSSCYSK